MEPADAEEGEDWRGDGHEHGYFVSLMDRHLVAEWSFANDNSAGATSIVKAVMLQKLITADLCKLSMP